MYNLGLVLHKEGIQTGKSILLLKALRFYCSSRDLLRSLEPGGLLWNDVAFLLGLLNNMAHAHAILANFQEANTILEEIIPIIKGTMEDPLLQANWCQSVTEFWDLALIQSMESDWYAMAPVA